MDMSKENIDNEVDLLLKKIGKKVRELRKKEQRNYELWVKGKNINKVTLNRCERGEVVTTKNLFIILNHLNVSPAKFFKDFE